MIDSSLVLICVFSLISLLGLYLGKSTWVKILSVIFVYTFILTNFYSEQLTFEKICLIISYILIIGFFANLVKKLNKLQNKIICTILFSLLIQGVSIYFKNLTLWKINHLTIWSMLLFTNNQHLIKTDIDSNSNQLNFKNIINLIFTIFPPWNIQLFGNIPTEEKNNWVRQIKNEKHHIYSFLGSIFIITGLLILEKITWKFIGLFVENVPNHFFAINKQFIISHDYTIVAKILVVYANIFTFFLNFAALTTLANACAKMWGYQFTPNVKLENGLTVFNKWTTVFHYLNKVITDVVVPLIPKIQFVKSKKTNFFIRHAAAIYIFGFLVVIFAHNPYSKYEVSFLNLLIQRSFYLTLIVCYFALKFFFNLNKIQTNHKILFSVFNIFILFPIFTIGMLSLNSSWFKSE